jgi:hypothetical protein
VRQFVRRSRSRQCSLCCDRQAVAQNAGRQQSVDAAGVSRTISDLAENQRHDQFIPVRKADLLSALIKQGDLTDPGERELFWRFARTLTHDLSLRIF